MTVISNDPSYWPIINSSLIITYWTLAATAVVVYDWVLALGQEIELIWRQRWSLMTVLYLVIRYIGIPYFVTIVLLYMPFISVTNTGCNIIRYIVNWTTFFVAVPLLGAVTISRLYAMYQGSRKMLIFLIVIFLATNIACVVLTTVALSRVVMEDRILFGVHSCSYDYGEGDHLLGLMIWMFITVWEVLALCLSIWVGVKHFHDLRRFGPSKRSAIGDCFTVLIKSHVLYFASFVGVSVLMFWMISLNASASNSTVQTFHGLVQVLSAVQMFVLGPRLILSVREYHAKLVANSDVGTHMTSIAFLERVNITTSSTV